jgi:hypothetical protein
MSMVVMSWHLAGIDDACLAMLCHGNAYIKQFAGAPVLV